MNKDIMKAAGFTEQVELVEAGHCPCCKHKIGSPSNFKDELSLREFFISGLCQDCQDQVFGLPE